MNSLIASTEMDMTNTQETGTGAVVSDYDIKCNEKQLKLIFSNNQ